MLDTDKYYPNLQHIQMTGDPGDVGWGLLHGTEHRTKPRNGHESGNEYIRLGTIVARAEGQAALRCKQVCSTVSCDAHVEVVK